MFFLWPGTFHICERMPLLKDGALSYLDSCADVNLCNGDARLCSVIGIGMLASDYIWESFIQQLP